MLASDPMLALSIASESDRKEIYKIRHLVYAKELKQHAINSSSELKDNLDSCNHYIVAKQQDSIIGFISITPPGSAKYSVDKYFSRCMIPYLFDDYLYEVRLLTVIEPKRKSALALAL